jgi:hypothetical protein
MTNQRYHWQGGNLMLIKIIKREAYQLQQRKCWQWLKMFNSQYAWANWQWAPIPIVCGQMVEQATIFRVRRSHYGQR